MDLLPGVRAHEIETDRLRTHYLESGPAHAPVVVMVHGNLSTGRFYEHLMPDLPQYRVLAPDMRGFGRSQPLPSTRASVSVAASTRPTSTLTCVSSTSTCAPRCIWPSCWYARW